MALSVKARLAGAVALGCLLAPHLGAEQAAATAAGVGTEPTRYYITARARLVTPDKVSLFGASNLPAGSVLTVYIYDPFGPSAPGIVGPGPAINNEVRVCVNRHGLFEGSVRPKGKLRFRANMVCQVRFQPNYPPQPSNVARAVGTFGEYLGTTATNPQIEGNSRVSGLMDDTIISQ